MGRQDPIQRVAEGTRDLYDVVSWEPRSALDRLSVALYGAIVASGRALVVMVAVLIVGSQFALSAVALADRPVIAAYVLLSVVPAFGLAAYVYRVDVTMGQPLGSLVVTFLLGFAFAGFAAVVNTVAFDAFAAMGLPLVLFFFLVVAPAEETVKLLAVRLHAFRSPDFDAVVDGAVYGAIAGLGFATIENTIYITDQYVVALGSAAALDRTLETAAIRTFAGPGHVIYSAFAGYYLGLAKFNPERRGPIVVKGLLIAGVIHATYNSLVTNLGAVSATLGVGGVDQALVFIGFVVVFDGVFAYALYRKLAAYRREYFAVGADRLESAVESVERDEFEWDRR